MNLIRKILLLLFAGGLFCLTLTGTVFAQQNSLKDVLQKARELGISETALGDLTHRASEQGISDEDVVALIQPAIDMADKNLPGDLALEKAMEGFSKGIPAARIIPVLQRLNQTTAEAATIVDPWLKKPDVKKMIAKNPAGISEKNFRKELTKATSKAFNQNVSREIAKKVFNEMGTKSVLDKAAPPDIIAAVGILPDMPQEIDPSQSSKFLVRALKGGFSARELQNLPSAMNMAQQRSQLPAASVVEGVSKQLNGGIPAKEILQNLFNGQIGGGPPGNIPKGLENKPDGGNKGNQGNN